MRDYRFIPYEPDKPLELAPDIRKWLPPNHLALFISDVVDTLDLGEITGTTFIFRVAIRPITRP
jgi:hypothetical protein